MRAPEAREVLRNYRYLQRKRGHAEKKYRGQWVASLKNEIYADERLDRLLETIESKHSDAHRAYVEHID